MGWVFNHKKKPGCPCNFFATENKEQNERESVFAAQYSAVPQYELREFEFFFEYVKVNPPKFRFMELLRHTAFLK